MQRQIITLLFITLSSAALLASACTAHVTEGCLDGPCTPNGPGMGGGSSSSSSSSGGNGTDGGDEGGLNSCVGMDPPATGDFPCDVFAVIHTSCNPCHTNPPMNGAPFPLLTFEDTQGPYGMMKIYQTMNLQIRPGANPRMPFGKPPLSDADLKTLGDWLNSCAPPLPEGTGCECTGKGVGKGCN